MLGHGRLINAIDKLSNVEVSAVGDVIGRGVVVIVTSLAVLAEAVEVFNTQVQILKK